MTTIISDSTGFEIDHGDRDLSSVLRNGVIEVAIGEGYGVPDRGGYISYTDISLTIEEARAFYTWLGEKLK